jgi:hypothetical protein
MALLIEAGQMTASDYVPIYPDLPLASDGASTEAIPLPTIAGRSSPLLRHLNERPVSPSARAKADEPLSTNNSIARDPTSAFRIMAPVHTELGSCSDPRQLPLASVPHIPLKTDPIEALGTACHRSKPTIIEGVG